jgi:hypothetical protein
MAAPQAGKSRTSRIVGVVLSTVLVGSCTSAGPRLANVADVGASKTPLAVASPVRAAGFNPAVDDRRVFVEGDSLTVGVSPFLPALLYRAGWTVTMDDEIGRSTATGINLLAQRSWDVGGTLVMALGTNDVPDPVAFSSQIDEVMTMAAGRRVIWVTVARAGWDALNRALYAAEARWSDLQVIDWRPIIAAQPAMRAADGIHLTVDGYELRARFIAAAIGSVATG